MDDREWAKIPDIPADSFLIDLEDSVPPPLKDAARTRAVAHLHDREHFGGRLQIARPNHLSTPWGRDDVIAFAEANVTCLAYPKLRSSDELAELRELLQAHGADPDIFATIETPGAVVDMAAIARSPKVVSLGLGIGDLSAEMAIPLNEPGGEINQLVAMPRASLTITAAAFDLHACDFAFAPDLRDLADVRRRFESSRRFGFTMGATFYPPHVSVINEVFTPSAEELAKADSVISAYQDAIERGSSATISADGRTILVHDFEKAMRLRRRAAAIAAATTPNTSE